MKGWRSTIYWMIGLLLLAMTYAGVRIYVSIVAPWPARAAVRLEPARPDLTADAVGPSNAFYYIRQLGVFTNERSVDYEEHQRFTSEGVPGAYPGLDACWESVQSAIPLCALAAEQPTCQVVTVTGYTSLLTHVTLVRSAARLLGYRAAVVASNRPDEAVDLLTYAMRISDGVSRGGTMIEMLVAIAGRGIICRESRRIAATTPLPAVSLRRLILLMEDVGRRAEPFAECIRYERRLGFSALPMVYSDGIGALSTIGGSVPTPALSPLRRAASLLLFVAMGSTPSVTSNHMDAVYSMLIDRAEKPYDSRGGESAVEAFMTRTQKYRLPAMLDDGVGRILVTLLTPATDTGRRRWLGNIATLRATAVCLALRGYMGGANAGPPDALDRLVPEWLSEVPLDPFSPGQPMRYVAKADRWVVYSVGPDMVDDGGQGVPGGDMKNGPDICFSSDEFVRLATNLPPATVVE